MIEEVYFELYNRIIEIYVNRSIVIISESFVKASSFDEVTLFCLVKNGRFHIDEFVRHYRGLGIRRIVFLDNNSNDGTMEALKVYSGV